MAGRRNRIFLALQNDPDFCLRAGSIRANGRSAALNE
jgi:hypothetical protein